MAFDPAIPLASDSPSVFPAQSQGNFTQLQKIITADHQFNLTATANDGYHNLIHMTQQSPSTTPIAVTGRFYSKLSTSGLMELFFMDDTPVTSKNYQITPTMPIRAAVNFTTPSAVSLLTTINSQYNVASVTNSGIPGAYVITFTTAMPDQNYIVQVTGQQNAGSVGGTNGPIIGSVYPATTWPNANVGTASVSVYFTNINGISISPMMGNVTIFSVT